MEFLKKILPEEGLYCVAEALPKGGFKHYFSDDLAVAQAQLVQLDSQRRTCYIAQGSFSETAREAQEHNQRLPRGLTPAERKDQRKGERTQANVLRLKSFFLDIDCGENWALKNQMEGVLTLNRFIQDTRLPPPAVVNSGNGLYAYWILSQSIPSRQWRSVAVILKQVVVAYAPAMGDDSSRTSDAASVLRPIGTTNRKPGKVEKPVTLLRDVEPIEFFEFAEALGKAAAKKKVNREVLLAPKAATDLNAGFFSGLDGPEKDPNLVADNCQQVALMRRDEAAIVHDLWFLCVGVLTRCADGANVVRQWTRKSTRVGQRTEDLIAQWQGSDMGPSTCASFGTANPQGCVGCPHNGRVKSPISLGLPTPKAVDLSDGQCEPPEGYRRSADGLYVDRDGVWVRFYDRDLWIDQLAYDESVGYEVMTIKHSLPHEGDMECVLRSSLVTKSQDLITALSDNHIKVVGAKEKQFMGYYLEGYQAALQRQRRMGKLLCQMGWKEPQGKPPMFVLGKKIFHPDLTVEEAGLARNVPRSVEAYHTKGDPRKWVNATAVLGTPGLEPHAFAFLAGGFGAPLFKFTGFDGAILSMVGDSGAGKTLMLRLIQSVWGHHQGLMVYGKDTANFVIQRVGVYGNLPVVVDEVTNIANQELSSFAYQVTQGRDKGRLTRNAEEKKLINSWSTIAVTSANNASLSERLAGMKQDASAEINRIFEYPVNRHPEFQGDVTTELYWTLHANYGYAGVAYIQWVLQNRNRVSEQLGVVRANLDAQSGATGEERFWSAVTAVAIYGGAVAAKLGLLKFDIRPIKDWAVSQLRTMRANRNEATGTPIEVLAQFIDEHMSGMMIVKGTRPVVVIQEPRGSLCMRYELDTHTLFVSRPAMNAWMTKNYGAYGAMKKALMEQKVLVRPNVSKTLTAGTHFAGTQQKCWQLDLSASALEGRVEIGNSEE
jgi:hypothetical protein